LFIPLWLHLHVRGIIWLYERTSEGEQMDWGSGYGFDNTITAASQS